MEPYWKLKKSLGLELHGYEHLLLQNWPEKIVSHTNGARTTVAEPKFARDSLWQIFLIWNVVILSTASPGNTMLNWLDEEFVTIINPRIKSLWCYLSQQSAFSILSLFLNLAQLQTKSSGEVLSHGRNLDHLSNLNGKGS